MLNAPLILEHYKHRGYPDSILQSALDKVRLKPRMGLIRPIAVESTCTEENSPFFCITPYHPHNPPIKAIIQKNWQILETDPRLANICHENVIVGAQEATKY